MEDRTKQNGYQRDFYLRNKEKVRKEIKDRKLEIREWYTNYKETLSCLHCGEDESCCLAFHHRDPSKKDLEISKAVNNGWAILRLEKEIDKCDVVCHNCHSKIHAGLVSMVARQSSKLKVPVRIGYPAP
jgi:transcription elongation factor Elf1